MRWINIYIWNYKYGVMEVTVGSSVYGCKIAAYPTPIINAKPIRPIYFIMNPFGKKYSYNMAKVGGCQQKRGNKIKNNENTENNHELP